MMQGQKTLVGVLAVAMLAACVSAITSEADNPYQKIVERNVFGLKPPPPPPSTEPPKPPTPKITLTGITSMGSTMGKTRALMKTPPPPAKPGEPPKGEQHYILAAGERDGDMEVVEIDPKAGVVKVKYAGTEVALNFVDNGAKPMSAPVAPVFVPGQPGMVPPPPGGVPGATTTPGAKPLPTRTLRLPTQGAATGVPAGGVPAYTSQGLPSPVPNYGVGNPSVQVGTAGGNVTLPAFNMSGGRPTQPTDVVAPVDQISGEEQMVLMEVQREQNRRNPTFPPLPPTPFSPQQPSPQQLVPQPPVPRR